MVEVLALCAAIPATTQLLEQAFRILGRLRKAYHRQKALVDVLERHENELRSIKSIIGVIDDEDELKTPSVTEEISRLREVQHKLAQFLEGLDPKAKNKVGQFAHQLTHGSADEKSLGTIMTDLVHVKTMLLLRIQVTSVGVMRTMEKQLVANAAVIERIDQSLREEVDDSAGLRIAKLLKGRRPSHDGTVPLTLADIKSLTREDSDEDSADETLVDDSEMRERDISVKFERIILRNTARQQAVQINAALEKDIWKDMDRLVIKDNVAEDQAVQINHGTTFEAVQFLLDNQFKRLAAMRP